MNDAKYDGSYDLPAAFVLGETSWVWAVGSTVSNLTTAEALIAS